MRKRVDPDKDIYENAHLERRSDLHNEVLLQ